MSRADLFSPFFVRFLSTRFRVVVGIGVVAVLAATFVSSGVSSVHADEEQMTPVVGSFAVGGSVTAGVNEQSGVFTAQIPLSGLPGVDGNGGVNVELSYSQDAATVGSDGDGLGAWGWGVSQVLLDGGVRVVTPSSQVFAASQDTGEDLDPAEVVSGLQGYVQGDLVFSQHTGNESLDAREGVRESAPYKYSLEHLGGMTDYFGVDGRILARIDAFDYRTDWKWVNDRLVGVIDAAGSEITLNWSDTGVEIVSPPRNDDEVVSTVLKVTGNRLLSITDPLNETVELGYDGAGLLEHVAAGSGAVTQITYQDLPNNHLPNNAKTVDEVRVLDSETGQVLSKRAWKVMGVNNPQGSPTYSSAAQMWASGDESYRYETVLTDGDGTRIESLYNSMGLMLSRQIVVSTLDGEYTTQEQAFTYEDTEDGGVPDRNRVPGTGTVRETHHHNHHLP